MFHYGILVPEKMARTTFLVGRLFVTSIRIMTLKEVILVFLLVCSYNDTFSYATSTCSVKPLNIDPKVASSLQWRLSVWPSKSRRTSLATSLKRWLCLLLFFPELCFELSLPILNLKSKDESWLHALSVSSSDGSNSKILDKCVSVTLCSVYVKG